jgi:hypothetical protein
VSPSLLPLLLACATGGGGPVADDAGVVVSIEVEPAEATVVSGPAGAGTADFTAIATFEDGTREPITLVSWELSNQAAGSIDSDGTFTASIENGALAVVSATHNGIEGTATLKVVYEEEIVDGTVDTSAFDGAAAGEVTWLYPEDGVTVPRNVPSLTFMWDDVPGATGYRLSFATDTTAVTVFTDDNRWTAEAERWVSIAATNAGGQVSVDLRAVAGGQVYAAPTRTLNVNRLDAQGSIYYWSTTDSGIVKVPISAEEPELFYAPRTNAPTCVACHVVRGDRMGVSYSGSGGTFYTGITDVSSGEPAELTARDQRGYYNTMNPDGTRLLSTMPDGGLALWDAVSGERLKTVNTGGRKLTQPDWSPDGTFIAAIQSDELVGDNMFADGVLVVAAIDDDGNLGAITELFDPVAEWGRTEFETPSVFYPSISPDGRWIAFNYGGGSSYDNDTASLWVIPVDGGDPIELARANLGEDLANSWPHWGPLPDDDVFWLTYSSKRPYGDEVVDGRPQIWVAAFDPSLAEQGLDPSSPAFWLPNQDVTTSNHTTFWGP